MKTKVQKHGELEKARTMLESAQAVLLLDFSNVKTADLQGLRRELKNAGSPMRIIKKRLLGLLLKEKGIEFQTRNYQAPAAVVFAADLEAAAQSAYRFLRALETEKKITASSAKILGGFEMAGTRVIPAEELVAIGKLPPREVLLGQLLGMLAAPIRSFLYVLDQKAKQG